MSAALRVVAPGLHTTVQDRGRFGFQALGVPVSGALDSESFEIANRLAGNAADVPALEILHVGPTLEVAADSVRIAVAGQGGGIELLRERSGKLGGWRSAQLRRGDVFCIPPLGAGACCYLAVEGGFAVAPVLDSAATYTRGGFGGFGGRAIAAGDTLPLALESATERQELSVPVPPQPRVELPVQVVLGPQLDFFTDAAIRTLLESEYKVSKNSDRMGMRLDGPKLAHRGGYDIVSDGIATGAIQVPGSGQAILLLADHQTTGGYPKIATVISADLPAVGRRKPGDRIRFAAIGIAEAERIAHEARAALDALIAGMVPPRPAGGLDLERLADANLISGVVFDRH